MKLSQSATARLAVLLLLALPLQAAEQMTRFFAQPGSKVWIKGSNNYHHWEMQGDVMDGFVDFGAGFPIESGQIVKAGKMPAKMEGLIPVRSLHISYRSAPIDSVVYYAMNEPIHPRIHFRFDELVLKKLSDSKDAPYLFDSRCQLVVAGVTNQISMPVGVFPLGGKQLRITASTSLKMTDWGIKPPEAQDSSGSKFRTANAVRVSFEWLVGPKPMAERAVEIKSDVVQVATNFQPYSLKTMGGVVTITNPPSSNPVHVSFVRWESDSDQGNLAVYRLTNSESHAILVWNIRSQVRSTGPAAAPSGWETVTDDYYPLGPGRNRVAPGQSDEFWAKRPDKTPWRVCILYHTDWTDSGNTYSGNYEVIGEEMKE